MFRTTFFLAVMGLVAACSGDDTSPAIDAPMGDPDAREVDAAPPIDAPSGGAAKYVVSKMKLPTTSIEATQLGLDIDDVAGDGIDNQLGNLLATLNGIVPGLGLQASIDAQVDNGDILLLASLTATAGAGTLALYPGDNPLPTPCSDASDTTCRRHLTGTGSFDIAAGAIDSHLDGTTSISGIFDGGPGEVTLPIALSGSGHVDLRLHLARTELVVTPTGLGAGSKIGGAITQADLDATLIPALQVNFAATIAIDCPAPASPPGCNCASGSTGATLLSFADANHDCEVTEPEVAGLVHSVLAPDIDLDEDGVDDAVSIGLGVSAVTANFTP